MPTQKKPNIKKKKSAAHNYELFTKRYFEKRLKSELGYKVPVLHQKALSGKDNESYDIDLHYQLNIAGGNLLTLIECKYWNYKVQRRNVNDFRTVIGDIGAHKGFIVSKVGFDSGAISVAKKNGIGLYKLTPKEQLIFSSWTGTKDNLKKAYEILGSDDIVEELKGTFSGLTFSADTSLWHFLMIKFGSRFGQYLLDFCFRTFDQIDDSNFEIPNDIKEILLLLDVFSLSKEYYLYETSGLNFSLANEEFIKSTMSAIAILQFKAKELSIDTKP